MNCSTLYIHHPGIANHHSAPTGPAVRHFAAEPQTFNLTLAVERLLAENPALSIFHVSDLALRP